MDEKSGVNEEKIEKGNKFDCKGFWSMTKYNQGYPAVL